MSKYNLFNFDKEFHAYGAENMTSVQGVGGMLEAIMVLNICDSHALKI